MTVAELIALLERIEDKGLPVTVRDLDDYREGAYPVEVTEPGCPYLDEDGVKREAPHVRIG